MTKTVLRLISNEQQLFQIQEPEQHVLILTLVLVKMDFPRHYTDLRVPVNYQKKTVLVITYIAD